MLKLIQHKMKNTLIAPSVLAADFANLQRDIEMINASVHDSSTFRRNIKANRLKDEVNSNEFSHVQTIHSKFFETNFIINQ